MYCKFKTYTNGIGDFTAPRYVWVNKNTLGFLGKHRTKGDNSTISGYGTEEYSELLESACYIRVYDCGRLRLRLDKENSNGNNT